jgi:phage terminase large subunit GpA-like protein
MSERKRPAVLKRIRESQVNALHLALRGAFARAYAPPPKMPLSEWADKYRVLSPEAAALPGRWKTMAEPMAKGVMDCVTDPLTEKVTVMAAAQVLKTEFVLNAIGYYAHGEPGPMLVVYPTVEAAEMFSKERLAPMLRDTPVLKKLFTAERAYKDSSATILQKGFPGGRLSMVGANAPAGLASRPIRFVLCDEVDRYPASAGGGGKRGEGDPVGLAEERTSTFANRKIVLVSTPTTKGHSRIEESFELGDQRRFHVPCPHCGVRQVITWAGVKWGKDASGAHDPGTAHYVCQAPHDPDTGEVCGKPWTEAQRQDAITRAVEFPDKGWIASRPFKGHASFHASQLSSKRVPLSQIVKKFLDAQGNVESLKKWTNLSLAETWEEGGERADPTTLFGRRENYSFDPLPEKVGLVTAGVDIQANRWEGEVVGWGDAEESWSLQYRVHYGDPTSPSFWEALDDFLLQRFSHPLLPGQALAVDTACIDSGFETSRVYDFCRPRFHRRVFAIKGPSNSVGRPVWPKKATRNVAKQTDVFLIGLDDAKSVTQRRLLLTEPGPGYCHYPKQESYDEAYFTGLTIEKRIIKYKFGRAYNEWVTPDGGRNEPWDCRIYAFAARRSSPVDVARRLAEWRAAQNVRVASIEPPKPQAHITGRRVHSAGVTA